MGQANISPPQEYQGNMAGTKNLYAQAPQAMPPQAGALAGTQNLYAQAPPSLGIGMSSMAPPSLGIGMSSMAPPSQGLGMTSMAPPSQGLGMTGMQNRRAQAPQPGGMAGMPNQDQQVMPPQIGGMLQNQPSILSYEKDVPLNMAQQVGGMQNQQTMPPNMMMDSQRKMAGALRGQRGVC